MAEIYIENIVASFQIAPLLDLPTLATVLPDATYNPTDVSAVVLSFKKPRAVALLFSTGTVTVTGVKTQGDIEEIIQMLGDRLMVLGIQVEKNPLITMKNLVGTVSFNKTLDLRAIANAFQNTEYDPKSFPGLLYKTDDPNTVILVFDSGKVVCNGPTKEAISSAMDKMIEKFISIGIKKEENVCPK